MKRMHSRQLVLSSLSTITLLGLSSPLAISAEVEVVDRLTTLVSKQESRIRDLEDEVKKIHYDDLEPAQGSLATPQAPVVKTYIIQEGDTITEIAKKHRVPRALLMAENGLKEGQQIYIGDPLVVPNIRLANDPTTLVAKSGTSKPKGSTVVFEKPKAPESKKVKPKQVAPKVVKAPAPKAPPTQTATSPKVKPVTSPPAPLAKTQTAPQSKPEPKKQIPTAPKAPTPKASSSSPNLYTVQYGDNLFKIAKKHGTTVKAIMAVNGIDNANQIKGGQKLKIPRPGTGEIKVAAAAPTPAPVKTAPKKEPEAPAPAPASTAMSGKESFGAYTVQKGDTLWSLSRDFFCSQAELQKLNKLGTSTTIRVGDDIVVPTTKFFEKHKGLAAN